MVDPRCRLRFPEDSKPPEPVEFPILPRKFKNNSKQITIMKYNFGYKVQDNYFVKSIDSEHNFAPDNDVMFGCDKSDIEFVWTVDRVVHIVQPDQISVYLKSEHNDNSKSSCRKIIERLLNCGFKHVSGELPEFLTDLVSK